MAADEVLGDHEESGQDELDSNKISGLFSADMKIERRQKHLTHSLQHRRIPYRHILNSQFFQGMFPLRFYIIQYLERGSP